MPFSASALELASSAPGEPGNLSGAVASYSLQQEEAEAVLDCPGLVPLESLREEGLFKEPKTWYLRVRRFWSVLNLLSHLGMKRLPGIEALREYRL